ncbi:carbohydrate ABC transporter permease [Occultella gossypii]|uniref:Sugar ABC transporter permease n=1 Tax=Occultella gossypii TaxID=2800820 RepID=A0ABS7SBL7_9MICO|nr:sugar ABC transporter permease [Occultella gossypii]MBZ2196661.1 sugar ABC transporter permease [Occultella gossypii]
MTSLTSRRSRLRLAPYLFLAPALILATALLTVPIGYTVWRSLHATRITGGGLGVAEEVFVGIENYVRVLGRADLLPSFGRLLGFAVIFVPTAMVLALVFALLLDNVSSRLTRFSRISIFVPYAVPGVIAALMWGFMYLPGVSPFHDVAAALGLPRPDFLGHSGIIASIANIAIWGAVGFNMVILYTALRGLPNELYDAARIDGCSEWQLAIRIKVPLVVPGLILTGMFTVIGALQVFSEPNTMVTLSTAIGSDWVPMMVVYRDAFITNDLYGASALAIIITVVTLAASFLLLGIAQRRAFGSESRS